MLASAHERRPDGVGRLTLREGWITAQASVGESPQSLLEKVAAVQKHQAGLPQTLVHLALRYCRGVDRKDSGLLRELYTTNGIDNHGEVFQGDAAGYVDFLESSFAFIQIGAHYVCNHLIELDPEDPDRATGEVYALGYHIIPGPDGSTTESFVGVRYLDQYQRTQGTWQFSRRDVLFDLDRSTLIDHRGAPPTDPAADPSYGLLKTASFRRGQSAAT